MVNFLNEFSISVIIPTINEQSSVASAIRSAKKAGANEVIVVDGNSFDETVSIATSMNCRVLMCEPGRGGQQDTGARAATGDVLVFLHADARMSTGSLAQLRSRFSDNVNPRSLWGCYRQYIDAHGMLFRWIERGNEYRARARRMVYGDQCFWMHRELYELSGGFPSHPLMEDVAMSDRLRRFGRPVILCGPVTVSPRRWLQRGVVRQTIRNWTLFGLYRAGVSPQRIAGWYRQA